MFRLCHIEASKEHNVSKEHLATYLNDHLAGAHFALEILDHLVDEASDWKAALTALRTDIEQDRQQLKALMSSIAIDESRVRKASGWLAEGLAEVKMNIDDDSNGPLRRLERLEALAIGIEGKIALWRSLAVSAESNVALAKIDYQRLDERGRDQRARVEALRLEAARGALT